LQTIITTANTVSAPRRTGIAEHDGRNQRHLDDRDRKRQEQRAIGLQSARLSPRVMDCREHSRTGWQHGRESNPPADGVNVSPSAATTKITAAAGTSTPTRHRSVQACDQPSKFVDGRAPTVAAITLSQG
jgi:hypothetical protein